ncbi:MAG: hypothetical protein PHW76_06875 [Alphaproteobacteria bacterium]|nr:hypothetical protein [Alphaproteobacteria bacterium]
MKNAIRAPSIMIPLASFFLLAGCDALGLPNIFGEDDVPQEVKQQSRAVLAPPVFAGQQSWPRLGDVPSKPKDFISKEDANKSMDELEVQRSESETVKAKTFGDGVPSRDAASQNLPLEPPQFTKRR